MKAHIESGGEQAGTLTAIVNPFGMPMTLDFQLRTQQLQAATSLGIAGFIEEYLAWGEEHARLAPSPALYANMAQAEQLLGKDMGSSLTAREAKRLFHDFDVVTKALKPANSLANSTTDNVK